MSQHNFKVGDRVSAQQTPDQPKRNGKLTSVTAPKEAFSIDVAEVLLDGDTKPTRFLVQQLTKL